MMIDLKKTIQNGKSFQFLSCLILNLLFVVSAAHAVSRYSVHQSEADPGLFDVELDLPQEKSGTNRRLFLRGESWGLEPQVLSPRCGSTLLEKEGDTWVVPAGCKKVKWHVNVSEAIYGATDVSLQSSVSFPKAHWALLAEPTSLLRLAGVMEEGTIQAADSGSRLVGGSLVADGIWRIADINAAPEFFVIGDAIEEKNQVGEVFVSYIADDMLHVKNAGLITAHADALNYLEKIVFPQGGLPAKDRELLVVFIGIDSQHGHAGGAAGRNAFLVNYLVGEESKKNRAITLLILAHEQFHQLVESKRSGFSTTLPGWLYESLAQYYGLKSIKRVFGNDDSAHDLARKFINPQDAVKYTFPEVEAMYASDRPQALYLSYRQGATFWSELDLALQVASAGKVGLDEILPDLLTLDFPKNGCLPEKFYLLANPKGNKDISSVIDKYFKNGDR